jgi:hypothetical protein
METRETIRLDSKAQQRPYVWRMKYDGACSTCGIALRAGEVAALSTKEGQSGRGERI